ncbi:prepilin-type N-terminal cleavage/methylation domain-containing protein [Thalassotalea profundi]|uniref:MSHA pilin protein MshC n=1 Tax=Thalassotalea profundi TaxID=2036687 RepID=A0ABQ3IZI5_9GAMM|nr:prepilin-type N-terminal cleavage/methylation domain-containing protein [Thalassotalea profundi]GHE99173.1 MSHA pilin protein MshC [Thalassotalea profundi]
MQKKTQKFNSVMMIKGFTIIELIVVIIILGILAITVAPKFFSSNGFEQFTYRNEVVTTLRALQLRSMQQTSSDTCHHISVTNSQIGLHKTDTGLANNCDLSIYEDASKDEYDKHTSVSIDSKHEVTFSTSASLASVFAFDQMGRVIDSNGNRVDCVNPNVCQVIITGEDTLIIQIENEGYIHAL